MIIHPRPDQEFKIHEAIRYGLIENEVELLNLGLEHGLTLVTRNSKDFVGRIFPADFSQVID